MKAPKADTFPLVISKGHASVKIYRNAPQPGREKEMFTLSYVAPSGRVRRNFADLAEAKREADAAVNKLAKGDLEALKLTGRDAQLFVAATEALAPCGVSLDIAAREFAMAFEIIGFDGMIEAARHYKATVLNGLPDITVAEAVDKFYMERKDVLGVGPKHLKDIRNYLGAIDQDWPRRDESKPRSGFAGVFNCLLRSITPSQLSDYFSGLRNYRTKKPLGHIASNNRRRTVVSLFNFAKQREWLKKNETTAADSVSSRAQRKSGGDDVRKPVFTPAEMKAMLSVAVPRYRNYLALIAFGGLRADEICDDLKQRDQKSAGQLKWEHIDFVRNCIVVPSGISKTIARKIPLQPNLRAWLELTPHSERTGFIYEVKSQYDRKVTCRASGVVWKTNAHRHSFASYRLDKTQNADLVSLEMGNSPRLVKKTYADLVNEEDTAAYWNIFPDATPAKSKIVDMVAAAA